MSSNPDDVRKALADWISRSFDANGVKCAVYPRDVVSSQYPRVIVLPDPNQFINYNATMNGTTLPGEVAMSFLVEIKTASMEAESAQIALGKFLGSGSSQPASVPDAITALLPSTDTQTPQLGGAVSSVSVNTCQMSDGRALVDDAGKPTGIIEFTATIQVDIFVSRS